MERLSSVRFFFKELPLHAPACPYMLASRFTLCLFRGKLISLFKMSPPSIKEERHTGEKLVMLTTSTHPCRQAKKNHLRDLGEVTELPRLRGSLCFGVLKSN